MAADERDHASVGCDAKLTGEKSSILANMDRDMRERSGVFRLSNAQYSIWVRPSWHYFALFRLLQISQSYWAVHSVKSLGSDPVILSTLGDADRVEEVYGYLGEVWETPFWDWWFARGQYAFGVFDPPHVKQLASTRDHEAPDEEGLQKIRDSVTTYFATNSAVEGRPETLLLAVPVYGDRARILTEIAAMIDNASSKRFIAPTKLKILKRKFRRATINAAIRVAQARSYNPDLSLAELGITAKLKAGRASETIYREENPEEAQRELAMCTSRHLRRAWLYSENAARGNFFTTDPAPNVSWPKIDFPALRGRLETYSTVSRAVYAGLHPEEISSERRYAGRNRKLFPTDPAL